jgi:hypothetical protein
MEAVPTTVAPEKLKAPEEAPIAENVPPVPPPTKPLVL